VVARRGSEGLPGPGQGLTREPGDQTRDGALRGRRACPGVAPPARRRELAEVQTLVRAVGARVRICNTGDQDGCVRVRLTVPRERGARCRCSPARGGAGHVGGALVADRQRVRAAAAVTALAAGPSSGLSRRCRSVSRACRSPSRRRAVIPAVPRPCRACRPGRVCTRAWAEGRRVPVR
jgi:hypothetical protein